jgi:hypothetical protein
MYERLKAVFGLKFSLNQPPEEIVIQAFDEAGVARSETSAFLTQLNSSQAGRIAIIKGYIIP